jgi:hypothetical protein
VHRIGAEGWGNSALKSIVLAVDYDPQNDDPGAMMESESFVDGQRGLVITRSDWGRDALYMHMHVRGFSGGHVFADRSSILLGGLGRMWIPNGALSYRTRENSVVSVDGREVSNYNPARLAHYKRADWATFATADLRDTWNYTYTRLSPYGCIRQEESELDVFDVPESEKANWASGYARVEPFEFHVPDGWLKVQQCFNDMALEKVDAPQFTVSQWAKPHWLNPGGIRSLIRRPNETQFSKAFRTAGMVRPTPGTAGKPYALVLDDWLAADDAYHTYDWLARLAPDLELVAVKKYDATDAKHNERPPAGHAVCTDVILAAREDVETRDDGFHYYRNVKRGARALLVRVLQMDSTAASTIYEFGEKLPQPPANGPASMIMDSDDTGNTLQVRTVSKDPKFKLLLYASVIKDQHNRFVNPPETTWNETETVLTVRIGDQADIITFEERDGAATAFRLERAGAETFVYPDEADR